ncbi:protein phophatase 2C family protein [Talaromyces stipitatus ATCC 10500]|uniref:Protein phophatase 2C family protein n=1 Tax=Talaromyces stipitatus (strain ATCC 10500 / CBS 375.48 / QM 6759 / NRRL 1006) TaxID=441959 RepID=B8LU10_TALSN|nr:protein phophatase 2C family protein [Talaromyces stipitatus ATCC 10500]EED23840.1 protein phophatase 2C family protein [Talaromyces stipitatus ATCC 10500]
MRRAVSQGLQAFRTVRYTTAWRAGGRPASRAYFSSGQALALHKRHTPYIPASLHASMHVRNFSLAFLSTLVASGAWYAYKGTQQQSTFLNGTTNLQTRGLADTTAETATGETSTTTRRALLVENDQFYTAVLSGDQPLAKQSDDSDRRVLEMLTPEQATQKLRKNDESYIVSRGQGVVRYDITQVPSNSPIEDDHAEKIVEVPQATSGTQDGSPKSDWMFWGVFDGHSGWTTSAKLRNVLISYVARELNSTYKAAATDPSVKTPSPEAIDQAIKQGFVRLDNDIVYESVDKVMKSNSRLVAAEILAPALSGSCALLAFYDSQTQDLRIACAGDSRAVLGRRGPSGKWVATALSEDQTGGTPSEIERLRKEHPGEQYVVRNGRILGQLEPSRSFGDAFYKWKRETQEKIKSRFFGRTPHPMLKTPPYVTAEPVITRTKIDPKNGDFVVLATDGLWEMLTNEEVVGLVGQWLETQRFADDGKRSWLQGLFGSEPKQLPVEKATETKTAGQRPPIRQQQYEISGAAERFVVEDKNAATHLVRNAMGGKDRDMVSALLTLPSPYSRRYRDDITVEVIFFGESIDDGSVTINKEATASAESAKPRL